MKYAYLFLVNVLGSLLGSYPIQAQTLKIPNFARPTVTTPQINLPTSRPNITTPKVFAPTLTPQTSVSFPTTTTTISVPSFPNVNNLGDRLIQSPQTINFPSQKLPTQFLPASITTPNNLNSTLPLELIVPKFPNATATVNQLQLVPTQVSFPKDRTIISNLSLPTLSNYTKTPPPTVITDLYDNGPSTVPSFGIQLDLKPPNSTTTKTNFLPLDTTEKNVITTGGTFSRNLTLD
ncbi:MAG: hypothetical protein VKL42_15955 [Snowella sp.]|nr:hypothetical protein [Snowella sp.]